MDIYKVLKILSSESKAKIVVHLLDCGCERVTVTAITHFTNLKQANVSKHIMALREDDILEAEKCGREVIYTMSKDFRETWGDKIKQIVSADETLSSLQCDHKHGDHKCETK